ncbi:MAG: hypothetical protein V1754_11030, partial [Pseudomonadota bacterium]
PIVHGLVGWGFREFFLSENSILSGLNYTFARIGLSGFVPIFTPLIGLDLGFELRPLITAGQLAVDAYGSRNGGFAYLLRGGIKGKTTFGLFYFADIEYLSFSTSFVGLCPNPQDYANCFSPRLPLTSWPDRTEATKVSDSFVRVLLGIGYAL